MKSNIQKVKAIESQNKRKILSVNQNVDESSGIYFLTRADDNGIQYAYIGQAKHLLTRLAQHLSGYQHIDLSLKKHGLFSAGNVYGWKINFLHYPENELDEHEQFWIKRYAKNGYQMRNKTAGGQGEGKKQISEYRPAKGYYDGITQGKKTLARELSHIMEKHLTVDLKPEKRGNKVSEKQLEKFNRLLDEKSYTE